MTTEILTVASGWDAICDVIILLNLVQHKPSLSEVQQPFPVKPGRMVRGNSETQGVQVNSQGRSPRD
jgi:hypothetical protein